MSYAPPQGTPPPKGLGEKIVDSEVSMFKDSLSWQYLVPTLLGLALIGVGLALIFTKGGVAQKKKDDQTEEEKKEEKQWLYAGIAIGGFGLLMFIITRIVLMYNNPTTAITNIAIGSLIGGGAGGFESI